LRKLTFLGFLCLILNFRTSAQTDTFQVQYPELIKGLDSIGIKSFDNTINLSCYGEESKHELLIGVYKKFPFVNQPFLVNYLGKWFITYSGSGLVFQVDSNYKKAYRIDKTIHQGFNYGEFCFYNGQNISTIGGYGFWNFNGSIRRYIPNINSWDLFESEYPDSEILIINPGTLIQVDCTGWESKIFAANVLKKTSRVNGRIFTNNCYSISSKTCRWEYLGNTDEQLLSANYIHQSNGGLIASKGNKLYFIDLLRNNFFTLKLNDQTVSDSKYYKRGDIVFYFEKNNLFEFSLDNKTWRQIRLDKSNWVLNNSPVYNKPWGYYSLLTLLLILLILGILLWFRNYFKLKGNKNIELAGQEIDVSKLEEENPVTDLNPVNVFKIWFESLNELEQSFIRRVAKNKIDIEEFNVWFGLASRPDEVKKTQRHLIIKKINNSYSGITSKQGELILRGRHVEDKRTFYYEMNQDFIHDIRPLSD